MGEPLHRTQILLRKNQHTVLSDLASREGTSLSQLVRALLDEGLERRDTEARRRVDRRLAAIERIRDHGREALHRRGGKPLDFDPAGVIRQAREERDDEIIRALTTSGD